MLAERYLRIVLLVFAVLTLSAIGFVLYIDPLWVSAHENGNNRYQKGYNERLTKVIRLKYGTTKGEFNAVSLGSSRGTYLPVSEFDNYKVFNFSVSSLYPGEYMKMLELYAEQQGDPEAIIIGVDFFSTRNDWEDRIGPYIDDVSDASFLLKKIYSIDTLRNAITIYKRNSRGRYPSPGDELYDRTLDKKFYRGDNHHPYYKPMLRKYCRIVYGPSYTWNKSLPVFYQQLKTRFPETKFIIYTHPINAVLYEAMIHRGRLQDYKRWLTLLTNTFGEVYEVMGRNAFSENPDNYYDYHHFASEAGGWLINNVLEAEVPAVGGVLTQANLDSYLQSKEIDANAILSSVENPCAPYL